MSYLDDMEDPPVPKLVSTVPMVKHPTYPRVSSFEESVYTVRIWAHLDNMQVTYHVPRTQWDCGLERMNAHMHPWTVAQRFLNNAFDVALGR